MRDYGEAAPLQRRGVAALGAMAHRGGVECRGAVVAGQGCEAVVAAMRRHPHDGPLQERGAAALSAFIAGEGSGIVCGAAAEVAHAGTVAIAQHGGIEVRARRSARTATPATDLRLR